MDQRGPQLGSFCAGGDLSDVARSLTYVVDEPTVMLRIIHSTLLLTLAFAGLAQDAGVALFKDRGYTGEHMFINADWSAGELDPWANSIESVRVPEGWEVWLYEQRNFKGKTLRLTSSWDGKDNDAWMWRDDIRSVRIVRRTTPGMGGVHGALYVEEQVVLFSDRDYMGDQLFLTSDWTADEGGRTMGVESVRVPEGWEVWLYEQRNHKGPILKLTSCWNGMDSDAWKWRDDIRSMRIVRRPMPPTSNPTGIILFEDAGFAGEQRVLYADWNSGGEEGNGWNDRISSIKVFPGMRITVFEHAGHQGASMELDGDWSATGSNDPWNDRISSIRIERR